MGSRDYGVKQEYKLFKSRVSTNTEIHMYFSNIYRASVYTPKWGPSSERKFEHILLSPNQKLSPVDKYLQVKN